MRITRRHFMQGFSTAGMGALSYAAFGTPPREGLPLLGVCANYDKAAELRKIGFDFIEGGVSVTLAPDKSEAEYEPLFEKVASCGLPMRSCVVFIPSTLRLTGPEEQLKQEEALQYAVTACKRADRLGIPYIVLGSAKARNAPKGFDTGRAKLQFAEFCKQLGPAIADCKVTIVIEPLHSGIAQFIITVSEGMEFVDEINHPRIRLLADIFHMRMDKEHPDSIRAAGARILHCHVAEHDLMYPGYHGDDLRPYFRALRDIGYAGGISCECRWPKKDVAEAWEKAYATLYEQVYG